MRPYILVTNDDGVAAPGIKALVEVMKTIGDVIVVAPDGARSGQSSAITAGKPIRYRLLEKSEGLEIYSSTGTPTDCVKLAFEAIMQRRPDIVVSGINHGSNATINVIYSGTMGATFEGTEHGVPSIGFSFTEHSHRADLSEMLPYIHQITTEVLKNGLPDRVCLNVNAPAGKIKGAKLARQCNGMWVKEFEKRTDPYGYDYFWLTGHFENAEPEAADTDEWALNNGYVSIVPTTIDMTSYENLESMRDWDFEAREGVLFNTESSKHTQNSNKA